MLSRSRRATVADASEPVGSRGDDEPLRRRLTNLLEKTESAERLVPGYWLGTAAAERQIVDDMRAGRLDWRGAHNAARAGLAALDEGDRDTALLGAWAATDLYVAALEALVRTRPGLLKAFNRPAAPRGRPKKN